MKKLLFVIAMAASISCARHAETELTMPAWARNIAMPANLAPTESDTLKNRVTLFLTDYFPMLENADSLKVSEPYDISDNGDGTYTLTWDEQALEYGTLTVFYAGDSAQVPITPSTLMKPLLYTKGANGNTFTFGTLEITEQLTFDVYVDNRLLDGSCFTPSENLITITLPSLPAGRHFARVFATSNGIRTNDLLIPLDGNQPITDATQLTRHDHEAQVLYSLMIDRFCNGNKANDQPLNSEEVLPIVDYMGGDVKGITKKIEEGFFDSLGITTIWVSPVTQNPLDAWGYYPFKQNADGSFNNKYDPSKDHTKFSGYHGYWPIYNTCLDRRFATDAEFRQMIDAAHKHNMNVILDYVANHMHINSPTLQAHPDWVTDSIAPDGKPNFERWDDYRLTTWFDKHIPTLDLERTEVCQAMTDTALYWIENYELDGFRHDACKHIPLQYWRMFGHKLAQRYPKRDTWMIGETYGSPELIGSYVKTGMLNAQFDFNIYHTAIDAIGLRPEHSIAEINDKILESAAAYGSHHTMGNISGNHDKARFISIAGGALKWDEDPYKEAGWTREVGAGDSIKGYKRSLLLNALNLTIPGVPCIYQGDEYGQTGANDPDNRHMMRFDGYNQYEQRYLQCIKELIKLRRANLPLIYGEYIPLINDKEHLAFARTFMGHTVLVVLNNSEQAFDADIQLPFGLIPNDQKTVHVDALDYSIYLF